MLCTETASCGEFLYDAMAQGGAQALGYPGGELAVGRRADLVVLHQQSSDNLTPQQLLDRAIFCDPSAVQREVLCGGRTVR